MLDIHLIEKKAAYGPVEGAAGEWITGTWTMGDNTARRLIGGNVHLHTAQNAGCYLGGEIIETNRVSETRFEIRFRHNEELVNKTTTGNWSVESQLVER